MQCNAMFRTVMQYNAMHWSWNLMQGNHTLLALFRQSGPAVKSELDRPCFIGLHVGPRGHAAVQEGSAHGGRYAPAPVTRKPYAPGGFINTFLNYSTTLDQK